MFALNLCTTDSTQTSWCSPLLSVLKKNAVSMTGLIGMHGMHLAERVHWGRRWWHHVPALMSWCLFVMQELKQQEEHLVGSRIPCLCLSHAWCTHCLAELWCVRVTWVLDVVMMRSVLKTLSFQGFAWLLPRTPKPCAQCFLPRVSCIYMLAHTCAFTLPTLSSSSKFVMFCLPLVLYIAWAHVLYALISSIVPAL